MKRVIFCVFHLVVFFLVVKTQIKRKYIYNEIVKCSELNLPYPYLVHELEFHHRHYDYCAIDSEPLIDLHSQINCPHLPPIFE